jgi:hypothetical protein
MLPQNPKPLLLQVTVRGCFVKSFGVLTEHRFDDDVTANGTPLLPFPAAGSADPFKGGGARKKLSQRSVQVSVVPPLPLLVATIVGGEGTAVLYEGEVRDLQVGVLMHFATHTLPFKIKPIGRES